MGESDKRLFRILPKIWPCTFKTGVKITDHCGNERVSFIRSTFTFPKERCKHSATRSSCSHLRCRYGLLGPSGCGKTTLLRCLVGRLELNDGQVLVFGKRPGSYGHEIPGRDVGYMPQENALYKNFSISEMLFYFGRLHRMNRKEIEDREAFLLSFLDLPSKNRKVCQLR